MRALLSVSRAVSLLCFWRGGGAFVRRRRRPGRAARADGGQPREPRRHHHPGRIGQPHIHVLRRAGDRVDGPRGRDAARVVARRRRGRRGGGADRRVLRRRARV
ncbi:MAG: hypothetical protein J3K34DRAFT_404044 [Monoraphidium minutum]|nr:MAG: hypothetical protein J3K34DRAFT_404044 [Monoraphidium minutum]